MRIAHIETGRHLYGGGRQVLWLLDALKNRGCESVLYALETSELIAPAVLRGHAVTPIRLGGDHDADFIRRFRRELVTHRPDLLHVHSRRGADSFGGLAARLAGVPSVLSRRVDNPVGWLSAKLRFWPYTRIIAISRAVASVLLSAGVTDKRLVTIPDAIETSSMVLSPEYGWFRSTFGIPPDVPAIGMIAQFIERKGHAHLLEALPLVLGEHPEARVVLFGRGPLEQELRMAVQAHGLQPNVIFAGFRDDLHRAIPCLDLVVHPALAEGMGVAVLEAAAAAVPVVGFAVGGVREAVAHDQTGLLVEAGDNVGLADAIRRLLADKDLARRFGVAGRRRVEAHFSMDGLVDAHLQLYGQVVSETEKA